MSPVQQVEISDDLKERLYQTFKLSHITNLREQKAVAKNIEIVEYLRYTISKKLSELHKESDVKSKLLSVIACINEVTHKIMDFNVFRNIEQQRENYECSDSHLIHILNKFIRNDVIKIIEENNILVQDHQLDVLINYCAEHSQKEFPKIFDHVIEMINESLTEFELQVDVIINIILDTTMSDICKLAQITQFIACRRIKSQGDNENKKRKITDIVLCE